MSTENLINSLKDGDNIGANKAFTDAISLKMSDALAAKRIEVASSLITRQSNKEEE